MNLIRRSGRWKPWLAILAGLLALYVPTYLHLRAERPNDTWRHLFTLGYDKPLGFAPKW